MREKGIEQKGKDRGCKRERNVTMARCYEEKVYTGKERKGKAVPRINGYALTFDGDRLLAATG